jgi:4'-phosphopantetheinyl transferase
LIIHGPYCDAALPGDVQVVRINLDFAVPLSHPLFDVLSDDERRAAARFHRAADTVRYAATRAVLRRELAAVLGEAPGGLRFLRSDRGRPALDTGSVVPPLDFNVSHGGDHALVAWSRLRHVGVDVEPERAAWDWLPLSRVVLGKEDARRIAMAGDEPARAALFLDMWAAKEALLKADGRGIADGLDGFSVLSEGSERPRIGGDTALAEDLRRFEARWLRGIQGHAACLAWSVDAAQP